MDEEKRRKRDLRFKAEPKKEQFGLVSRGEDNRQVILCLNSLECETNSRVRLATDRSIRKKYFEDVQIDVSFLY